MLSEDVFVGRDKGRLFYYSSYTWFEQTILLYFEVFDTVLLGYKEKKEKRDVCETSIKM